MVPTPTSRHARESNSQQRKPNRRTVAGLMSFGFNKFYIGSRRVNGIRQQREVNVNRERGLEAGHSLNLAIPHADPVNRRIAVELRHNALQSLLVVNAALSKKHGFAVSCR